ncbi:MAG TPA: transporter substrate-binding domain-containing protein [bacterium]|nr:transporter substrate-binding domain-containing protein [bacterium]
MKCMRYAAVLGVFLMTVAIQPSHAQSKLVMVTEAWAPFRINNSTAPSGFSGIDIDIINILERELGIKIEIQRHPWARALEMLRNGQADFCTGAAYTAERAQFMEYVPTSYFVVQPVFYAQTERAGSVNSYDDLKGKVIGQSIDSFYFEPYNSDKSLEKLDLPTEKQVLLMLSLGRIELGIGTEPNISYDVSVLGYRSKLVRVNWIPPAHTDLFFAFSRKSSAVSLVPRVDAALKRLLADGTIDDIASKYR